ncbi:MAG: hypothetical protein WCR30_02180 [Clostridia bacterium]
MGIHEIVFGGLLIKFFHENANTILEKKALLLKNNIALWDIIQSCKNIDSADNHLQDIIFSNLKLVLKTTTIRKILCNGTTAYHLTKKYCLQNNISIPLVLLPSTSPANTRFNFVSWQNELK